jgi:inhibitor of cysteine peptidase
MDHLSFFVFVASTSVLALAACSATQSPTPGEVRLSEKEGDCGSTVELNTGDTLVLTLEVNPTTGYTWEVESDDPAVIESISEPEYNPDSSAIGAGGTYTYRFRAVAEGQVTLRLIYHRPFETNVPELKSCKVTINVK